MILQAGGRSTRAILVAAAGLFLLASPPTSLSEEPSLALGQLPSVPIPSHNLQFDSKVELGKFLFFDPRLSKDKSVSCASCHVPAAGFADPRQFSLGVGVPQTGPLREDVGRYAVTRREADRHAFKTPSLRSVALTGPYMHTGSFKTLDEVVDFYNSGGKRCLEKTRS